ncbi:hypothetical protein KPH14_012879 [Odynerus spinipes]|uniref:RNA-directed DNA polymerase n=1 Tax=Odynerus spinipes TaxID=1348599 RepID=A0AAD9RE93_9HYME|nr:hypothetical protein KPH14_012879 [Odynerus spinipes]
MQLPIIEDRNTFKTFNGRKNVAGRISARLKVHKIEKMVNMFAVEDEDFGYDILLGLDSIQKFRLKQDYDFKIYQKEEETQKTESSTRNKEHLVNFNEGIPIEQIKGKLEHLPEEKTKEVKYLIDKYESIFAKNKFDVGKVKDHEAQIKLAERRFIAKKPYRCSMNDQKEIEFQIKELIKADLIEESCSPFAAPVTLAYKRDEEKKTRMCIDFRELNKLVIPEPQPFPLIDEIIAKTSGAEWFSALDINSAFWSIPVRTKDKYKTAFVTQDGHWQWKCLPFGLKNSPSIFQRILSNILRRNNLSAFCINYIDDIIIFSKSFEEHMGHLQKVLRAIYEEGFRLKFEKCSFAKSEVKYLGHIISKNTVRPTTENLISIRNFPVPDSRKKVRQFLGKVNFNHKYIPNTVRLLEPLHNLLRKNVEFAWTQDCEEAFTKTKKLLCSQPVLAIYNADAPTVIYTDASIEGLGAVLKQQQSDGEFKPVDYFSKKLKDYQKKKKAIFLECLAIKEAIVYWQYRLIGKKFTVICDHKPLEGQNIRSRTDEELGDMMHFLSQFDFDIKYEPGKTNVEADYLSRNPIIAETENAEESLKTVNFAQIEDIREDQKMNKEQINSMKDSREENGIVYKIKKNKKQVIVSEEFGKSLIANIHRNYGHICKSKVLNKIRDYYYFRNMEKMTKRFCDSCDICSRNKTRSKHYGLLAKLGPAEKPFDIVSLDTIGGFAGNRSSKRYLHLLVDHFTRYAFILTSKNQTAEDFIKLLKKIQDKHQIKTLLTDQYSGINSDAFKKYLKQQKINLIFTAVNCPFSNGLNERLNQTLVNRIRCKINETKSRAWSKIAEECTEQYNRTEHSVTGFSPEYLLFGEMDPAIPEELRPRRNLEKDRILALRNSQRNHMYNKSKYDKNRVNYDFEVGQMVYVENGSRLNRKKLDEVRIGPFPIIQKISNSIFEVDSGHRKKESNYYHISKLKPHIKSEGMENF